MFPGMMLLWYSRRCLAPLIIALASVGCAARHAPATYAAPSPATTQLVVVVTPDWTATTGRLQRFERSDGHSAWRPVSVAVPVVVGRTGLALGAGFDDLDAAAPHKHEGDGKSPAGVFPLDTVFGFAPRDSAVGTRLPYVQLTSGSDCVDDTSSMHYNTVVERSAVPRVDWASAEHMRTIGEYRFGVIVGYNAQPPRPGRGSCIFLHIWNGPASHTAGCTAFDAAELARVIAWLDPRSKPVLVQVTTALYDRQRPAWGLPSLSPDMEPAR